MLTNRLNIQTDSYSHPQKLPKFLLAKKQKSIKNKVFFKGKGLHTNNTVKMVLCPAPPNTGYLFKIKKENSYTQIKADFNNVQSTKLCTLISDKEGNTVSTIEHVLSACYGMEIDNLVIELDSNEIPVCDGSSLDFVREIEKAGFEEQSEFKQFIKIKKTIEIVEGNKISRVSPFEQTMITCEIDYKHKLIGKQSISLVLNPSIYKSQICPARTFGFLEDVEKLREMNLALGGSLDNAIVLDKNKILNKDGLRFSDEFVRHKVLDFIGDISLCGYRILGSFFTSHCGHDLNIKLLNKIFDSQENWELICSN
jgi:UDP-3-O-[3-hydroxymyristoyl] N-acetylglucosamine deacetylase